jgi:hypothetical protein
MLRAMAVCLPRVNVCLRCVCCCSIIVLGGFAGPYITVSRYWHQYFTAC